MSYPNIQKEHALETYKSLVQISVEGMKLLAVLHGGAAVALLAYLGNIAGKRAPVPDMRYPMGFFLAGLVLCGFCFVAGYATQFTLYNESMGWPADRFYQGHKFWLLLALISVISSLAVFGVGAYSAVEHFQ